MTGDDKTSLIEGEKTDTAGVCVEDNLSDPSESDSTKPLEPKSDVLEGQEYSRKRT